MPQSDMKRLRLKKGELRSIRADIAMPFKVKDPKDGTAGVSIGEAERGVVLVLLPEDPDHRRELALSVLGAIWLSTSDVRRPTSGMKSEGPVLEQLVSLIPIDGMQVLKPEGLEAPVGHAVLELMVGNVPLRFSAPAEVWQEALSVAAKSGIVRQTH